MSIRKISALASLVGVISMLASVVASATPLSVTYDGATFTLDGVSSPSNCGAYADCYDVTYTANFSGFTGGTQNQNYFSAISFNAAGKTIDFASNYDGSASSTVIGNGLSANGCGTSGSDKWVCATFDPRLATTGTYSFGFYVGLASGTYDFNASSVKMLFFSSLDSTKTTGLMSCNAEECTSTTVPEPATFALFAAGLAGLGFALDRRRKRA